MAAKQQASAAPIEGPPEEDPGVEAPASSAGLSPAQMEQLQQLAGLKDQGILTEEEFAAQKAQILAS